MELKTHSYRVGSNSLARENLPEDEDELDRFISTSRKHIEPWLSAVFQAEHLNLLVGSGFTTAIAIQANTTAAQMQTVPLGTEYDERITAHADAAARRMRRGDANIEDQFRSALAVLDGLRVIDPTSAATLQSALDVRLRNFMLSVLETERNISTESDAKDTAIAILQSFLLSFASRTASRERLHIFTTNYDRLLEYGSDLAGLRVIDRFVGALNPVFRSSRIEVDVHYNPPGIRGEPRFMEGVVRLTKLHGSLDWQYDLHARSIRRLGIPFGAGSDHSDLPSNPIDSAMIYPNPAKDVETVFFPYAELFRDMAAAFCRPNAVVVTYGYGFGDDHINRVLLDMLTVPSTHIVVIAYKLDERLKYFCERTRQAQVTLLLGPHFADIKNLVNYYLPKPALDYITGRLTELLKRRPLPEEQVAQAAGAALPMGGYPNGHSGDDEP